MDGKFYMKGLAYFNNDLNICTCAFNFLNCEYNSLHLRQTRNLSWGPMTLLCCDNNQIQKFCVTFWSNHLCLKTDKYLQVIHTRTQISTEF